MKETIKLLTEGKDIPSAKMRTLMLEIMQGELHPAAVGAFLTALSIKGESVSEVVAATEVLRELAKSVELPAGNYIDIVGTGGDGAHLFNVSTATAMIVAAGGVKVAKHGNIAASSTSGSADLLREAGIKLDLSPSEVQDCLTQTGFAFMFAQTYHQAMRHVVPVRKAIGIRTIFNVLGPLSNPAHVKRQVLGVFSSKWLRPLAEVLRKLGSERVILVCSHNGLDEFSVSAPNDVCELKADGSIVEYVVDPTDFAMNYDNHQALQVSSSAESLALIESIFTTGQPKMGFDMLALNAAAAFYIAGKVNNLSDGITLAKEIQQNGLAWQKLQQVKALTQSIGE